MRRHFLCSFAREGFVQLAGMPRKIARAGPRGGPRMTEPPSSRYERRSSSLVERFRPKAHVSPSDESPGSLSVPTSDNPATLTGHFGEAGTEYPCGRSAIQLLCVASGDLEDG